MLQIYKLIFFFLKRLPPTFSETPHQSFLKTHTVFKRKKKKKNRLLKNKKHLSYIWSGPRLQRAKTGGTKYAPLSSISLEVKEHGRIWPDQGPQSWDL